MSKEQERIACVEEAITSHNDRIKALEKKEERNYSNINELRRQIQVNDDEIAELKKESLNNNINPNAFMLHGEFVSHSKDKK